MPQVIPPLAPVTTKLYYLFRLFLLFTHQARLKSHIKQGTLAPTILTSLMTTLFLLVVQSLGWLQGLELASYDQFVRLRNNHELDPRVLLVTIDESDQRRQKRAPISDRALAEVIKRLQQEQPKVIGVDLYRDLPQQPGSEELKEQLKLDNIIAITNIGSSEDVGVPPPINIPAQRIGFNNLVLDSDGVVRRNLILMWKSDASILYSFAWQMVFQYLKDEKLQPRINLFPIKKITWGKAVFLPLEKTAGGYVNIDNAGYQIMLDYRQPSKSFNQISLTNVLEGNFDPLLVRGKIVLIGTTAPSSRDVFFTPYGVAQNAKSKEPGVLIHAAIVSQLLGAIFQGRSLFLFLPDWAEFLWLFGWSLLGMITFFWLRHPLKLALAIFLFLLSLFIISYGLFLINIWIPFAAPGLVFVLTGGFILASKQIYDSSHDALTGLPNRAVFTSLVQRALSRLKTGKCQQFAVLFIDLDRFQMINDSLGHTVGDNVLLDIVQRFKHCLSTRYFRNLARVGGDDFALLLENIDETNSAIAVAQEIHQSLLKPFSLNNQEFFMTVSIGIAMSELADEQPEYLLRNAHTAMYRAKQSGRGRYQVFNTAMYFSAVELLQMQTDLRIALKRQEFVLHYQPFVSLKTGKIMGFEALARWNHPQRGWVSPIKFIPVAEDTGLIIPLGQWVLEEACRQLQLWQKHFPHFPPLIMNVNLSGKQFAQPDLIGQLKKILATSGIGANGLKLEITESVVMEDVDSAIAVLKEMKTLGVKLGIDDFGTGYSSLSYLSRFPTDTLKVDKSFVGRLELAGEGENVAIVRTIITLAHVLGMDVIAEGVETSEQLAKLRSLGCEYGQGYFFSKPLPSEAIEELLRSDPQW
jgi:diguanylate cyclase (GGDEF)-like protein